MNEQQLEAMREDLLKLRKRKQAELNELSARITAANVDLMRLNYQREQVKNDIEGSYDVY